MRDYLCNDVKLKNMINHYNDFVKEDIEEIKQLEEDIKNGIQRYPNPPEIIIENIISGLCTKNTRLFMAEYTFGKECRDIEGDYRKACKYALQVGYKDFGYVNMLHYITAGILFEISKEEMQKLVDLIDDAKVDDLLFDYFVNAYGLERKIKSTKLQQKKPYFRVLEIVETAKTDKKAASKMLEVYVKKEWLKGHAAYGWTTFHKEPGYFGLWSFESGALAKILKLDDESIKDNNHYPFDLVHYKNNMIFNDVNGDYSVKKEKVEYVEGIKENAALEQIIPKKYHQLVSQVINDYQKMDDKAFWEKYELDQVWFDLKDFSKDKENGLLGTMILFELVDKGYILQLDWKEELEDYKDDIENYWDDEDTKIIQFITDSDQYYYARVPEKCKLVNMYEVKVEKV